MKSKSKGSSSSGGKTYLKINLNTKRRKGKSPIIINFCDDETESDETQSDETQSDSDLETVTDKYTIKADSKDKYKIDRRKKDKKIGRTSKHHKDKNTSVHSDEDSDFDPVLEDSDDSDIEEAEEEDDQVFEEDDGEEYDLDSDGLEDENDLGEAEERDVEKDDEDVDDIHENKNEVEEKNEHLEVGEEEPNDQHVRLDEDDNVEVEGANNKEVRHDEDDDVVEAENKSSNRKGRKKFEHKRLLLRNSHENFHTFMNKLNNKQKTEIRDLGFGSFINIPISNLPTKLAYYVLEKFDHTKCVLEVDGREVKVTKHMVHEVFGIPNGGKNIPYRVKANHSHKQVKKWKKQFNTDKPSLQDLYSVMNGQHNGGALFKLNFLVLFVTTMVEGIKYNTLNHKFLQYISILKEVRFLDWCDFLLTCLINTKKDWKNQRQFNGPIMFLMVLYVHELKKEENVQFPLIKNWTLVALKLIESEKLNNGEYEKLDAEDVTMLSPELKRKRALEILLSRKKKKDEQNKGHEEQVKQKETSTNIPEIIEDNPFTSNSENTRDFEFINDNPFTTTQTPQDFNTFTVENKLQAIKRTVKERLVVKEWLIIDTDDLIKMGLAIDSTDDDLNNYYSILHENITIEDFYRNNPFFSDNDFVRKSKLRKTYRNNDEPECSKKMDVDFSELEDILEDGVLGDKNNSSSLDKGKKPVVKNVDQKNQRKNELEKVQGETKEVHVEQPISMEVNFIESNVPNFNKGKDKSGYSIQLEKSQASTMEVDEGKPISESEGFVHSAVPKFHSPTVNDGGWKPFSKNSTFLDFDVPSFDIGIEFGNENVACKESPATPNVKIDQPLQNSPDVDKVISELPFLRSSPQNNVSGKGIGVKEVKGASTGKEIVSFDSLLKKFQVLGRETVEGNCIASPYAMKKVAVNATLQADEERLSASIFSARLQPSEIIFKCKHFEYSRVIFETMYPGHMIITGVIDAWVNVLNYEERKTDEKEPCRLFCPTNVMTPDMTHNQSPLLDDHVGLLQMFSNRVFEAMESSQIKDIRDIDLLFFPMVSDDAYYVVVFNLKTSEIHILDNQFHATDNIEQIYGVSLLKLKGFVESTFAMEGKILTLSNVKEKIIKMNWRTRKNNINDSGIFAMRHMEMYMGYNVFDFNCGFVNEDVHEGIYLQHQLLNLRKRYLTKILTSNVNEKCAVFPKEVENYYKLPEFQRKLLYKKASKEIDKRIEATIKVIIP